MEKTYKVLIQGTVTGVGFRYSTVREARRYGDLRGYVRNKDSRTVECVVQGDEEELTSFVEWLKQGPPGARVQSCEVSELTTSKRLEPFRISF
ncbi:MAG: acylphosphatase [Candidatus Pacebacteria bacterium]|nr:acylphosphatase [Candidatus Paceibacterota bacterium]